MCVYRPAYFIYRTGYEGSNPYGPIAYRGSARSYCALRLDRLISLVSACWRNEGICHRQLATCCCWSDGATAHFHRLKSLVLCSVQVITSVLHHQLICFCSPAAVIFQLRVLGVEWGGGDPHVWTALLPLRLFTSTYVCKHTVRCCPWLKRRSSYPTVYLQVFIYEEDRSHREEVWRQLYKLGSNLSLAQATRGDRTRLGSQDCFDPHLTPTYLFIFLFNKH